MRDNELMACVSAFGTPLYVYDERVLRSRVAYLRGHLPEHVELCYAMKANTFVVPELQKVVDCLEVCSPGELRICGELGIPQGQLVISGVYKDEATIDAVVGQDVPMRTCTVESPSQLDAIASSARRHGRRVPVLLRLTSGSQFGMDASVVRDIVRDHASDPALDILGIQFFSGTQKDSLKRLSRELAKLGDFVHGLEDETGFSVRVLEYGPGLPVDYYEAGGSADEGEFLDEFSELLRPLVAERRVVLELGRSIAASCGTYLTSVVDMKSNLGSNYAIVDGGMHQLVYYAHTMAMRLPPVHVLGQVDGASGTETDVWNICGALCTTSDILAKRMPAPGLKVGSVLAFEKAGAYCSTEGMLMFLSRDLPRIVVVDEAGVPRLVRDGLRTDVTNTPRDCSPDAAHSARR